MQPFSYVLANDVREVVDRATRGEVPIAGGTELLNWMRLGIIEPPHLIDIGRVKGMNAIHLDGERLSIGALATLNEVGENPLVAANAAVLGQACLKAASAQIRNRATLGGNALQKTRCAYFRAEAPLPWACNKRTPGTGCAALVGSNARHAIFGWTDSCVATQPSDPAVALAALDAEVEVVGPRGPRLISMTRFHVTPQETRASRPGGTPDHAEEARVENVLGAGEVITRYRIPVVAGERSAYLKVRERESYEYALVSAGVAIVLEGNRIRRVRIALGSVAHKPWRLVAAERALEGSVFDEATIRAATRDAMAAAQPLTDNGYKVLLAANTAARAVLMAGGRA